MSEKLPKLSVRLHQNLAKLLMEAASKAGAIEFSADELAVHKKYVEAFFAAKYETDAYEDLETDAA